MAVGQLLLGLGCRGVAEPSGPIGLTIAAGGGGRDTVLARLATPLVVQYRDASGRARSGVTVRIECVSVGAYGPRVILGLGENAEPSGSVVTDTTDAEGQVTGRVGFGQSAGVGWVRATAPALGLSDSTSYVVLPGTVARLTLAPADTAVYVARTVTLRGRTFDKWGNERQDALEWSATAEIVEMGASGQIRGLRIGRAMARASLGAMSDSVGVSVVPSGVIAAMFFPIAVGDAQYFVMFNTDGTGMRRIDVGADCAHGLQWSPTGDRLLFGRNPLPGICFTQRLYTATLAGTVAKIRPDTAPLAGEFWPRMTADGQWVYFSGRPGHQNGEIWRVRANGADPERVGPAADFYDLDQHPSPSPTGAEVVYASTRAPDWGIELRVINTTTRLIRDLGITGMSPSWSPQGGLIVFLRNDRYYVVGTDGSGERGLVDSRYSAGMPDPASWSPDGRWIVVVTPDAGGYAPLYGKLALVEVETGLILPLGWTAQLTYPSWRPTP